MSINQHISGTQDYKYYQGTDNVRAIDIINKDGCADSWWSRCKNICVVEVYAPTDGTGDIKIWQGPAVRNLETSAEA